MKKNDFSYIYKGNYSNKKNRIKKISIYGIVFTLIFVMIFPTVKVNATSVYTQKVINGINSFPNSYQKLLKKFVEEKGHENWNFQAYYTGIDWNEFVEGESRHGLNRIYAGYDPVYRCKCGDLASGYYCANPEITSYYMDPRNFINERNIFQFLDVSYNKEVYKKDIVQKMVSKYDVFNKGKPITFVMSDENHKDYNKEVTMTYTDIIMEAAEKSQMSPISMVIKIVQEVGASGSGSTSGTNKTYPNTYNFFNIGSSDSGDAILNGLKYADSKGWHCPYTSIIEGAMFNSDNYIKAGQNTAYFYKFDCVGAKILNSGETQEITSNNLYHQYMTNIQDPYSQSAALFTTYTNNELLDEHLNFIIPVFKNMPEEPIRKISTLLNTTDKQLYYADVTSTLYVREEPTTNSSVISTLFKDDVVVMLQRNFASEWDKVQLWDGRIAYIMSKYLKLYTAPVVVTEKETPNIEELENNDKDEKNQKVNDDNSNINNNNEEGVKEETKNVQQIPLININYGYANVDSHLNIRKNASADSDILFKLDPKQEFIILENINDWYKIKLLTGEEGYASKEFVTLLNYIKVEVKERMIYIIPNVTADVLAGKVGVAKYKIKKGDEVITNTNVLSTGDKIKLDKIEYMVIKIGDVNSDGRITPLDYVKIKNHIMKVTSLKDSVLNAADLNKDGKITPLDYVKVKNYIMKVSNISL